MSAKLHSTKLQDIAENLEYVGAADDSGFASISGSVASAEATSVTKDETLAISKIADDVKINNGPFKIDNKESTKGKRKRTLEIETENKRLAAEQYEKEVVEFRYKRLMHLLDRSQFYSKYLVQKIDQSLKQESKKPGNKRKPKVSDENSPPKKITKKAQKLNQDYDIREYVTAKDVKNKEEERQKMNLSQKEIANELMMETDGNIAKTDYPDKDQHVESVQLKYFVGTLRDYQIEGLKWLCVLYENGVNGILADEMGLGKTIQVIALICHLIEKKIPGPYLIIAPLSTIPNWLMEFENFAPKIPVVLLHGPPEERAKHYRSIQQKNFDIDGYKTQPVVLTTFEVPMQEENLLKRQQWRYIIIDEGHRVKNYKCQLLQVLKKCKSMNRLLLTGTPLQNNLSELWSLLNFLLPEIFNDLAVFESWFDAKELQDAEGTKRILQQEADKQVLMSLREILKPFMLRRVKSDVCLDIPLKKEVIVYAPLTELQHSLYKAVLSRDIQTMAKLEPENLIIPDLNGKRQQRRCRLKSGTSDSKDDSMSDLSSSRASTPSSDGGDDGWKKDVEIQSNALSMWKKYADVNERNQEFLIRIQWQNRAVVYKKIVNHPYLVHCPLNSVGLPRIDDEIIKNSGKLLVLDAMLAKLKSQGHKVLLFSTMTMILDMLEDYLELRDYRYVRLDGNFKIEDRKKNIKLFNSDPDVFLFLISTRAGGVGLNLAAADTVIMYDSDWNPQADIQAMARCHRIGQTRPVVVYKLCTKGTIDETIINRGEAKRKLEKMVISKAGLSLSLNNRDTLVQLKKLLESNENQIVHAENGVYTHKELDDLLDRSDLMPKKNITDKKKRNG
ncbi:lymphoid-specific helicase-like [Neodiprion virginianus]|uniref:lymphoid-specific helicase-like n=1 Tax=Neodiprion virginianus TaxID=2961670 RepID=UPI001EE69591|nr:lymphoid-specific helicase-like [Neodiprion virginianus]